MTKTNAQMHSIADYRLCTRNEMPFQYSLQNYIHIWESSHMSVT